MASGRLSDLLLLGRESDPLSERGVSCDGQLPAASDPQLVERAIKAKRQLSERVMILGHNYQRDEVINFADITGDSFKLAQAAASNPGAELIVFCGVHFMAESADILTNSNQKVILPDSKSTFWVVVNKPRSVLTTMVDEKDRDTLLSIVPKVRNIILTTFDL